MDKEYKEHARKLWPIFFQFAADRNGSQYVALLPSGEPFSDWSHHDRYAHRKHFDKADVDPHRGAAQGVRNMVEQATRDQDP